MFDQRRPGEPLDASRSPQIKKVGVPFRKSGAEPMLKDADTSLKRLQKRFAFGVTIPEILDIIDFDIQCLLTNRSEDARSRTYTDIASDLMHAKWLGTPGVQKIIESRLVRNRLEPAILSQLTAYHEDIEKHPSPLGDIIFLNELLVYKSLYPEAYQQFVRGNAQVERIKSVTPQVFRQREIEPLHVLQFFALKQALFGNEQIGMSSEMLAPLVRAELERVLNANHIFAAKELPQILAYETMINGAPNLSTYKYLEEHQVSSHEIRQNVRAEWNRMDTFDAAVHVRIATGLIKLF